MFTTAARCLQEPRAGQTISAVQFGQRQCYGLIMLIDLRGEPPEQFEADVAVVGAGVAGITMARRLLRGGKSVILLESGGLDYEETTADLNRGRNIGEPYYDLDKARLRFFGGTTAIWGGRCAEMDAIDFEHRPWVEHSGWPFDVEELRPSYEAARRVLDLPLEDPSASAGVRLLEAMSPDDLAIRCWMFDRRFDRFGYAANKSLVNHPRMTALTHATVREIVPAADCRSIERLEVRVPGGRSVRVRAQTYVLAAGGLENPRLLLASNGVIQAGLGNEHDLVGRFFMEHPHARGGRLVGASAWSVLKAFGKRHKGGVQFAPLLTASPRLQKEFGLLNTAVTIAARPPSGGRRPLMKQAYLYAKHRTAPTQAGRGVWKMYRRFGREMKRVIGPLRPWWRCVSGSSELALVLRAEQAPNPDSRVTLDTATDATGMPRIKLDWRLQEQDVKSAALLVEALGRETARQGLGEVQPAPWLREGAGSWVFDPLVSDHPIGGYHHMGTTRMNDDPRRGVTDRYGRVHGLENLYVAGSSLFPTSGWANPTLTIIALTLRTAERLLSERR